MDRHWRRNLGNEEEQVRLTSQPGSEEVRIVNGGGGGLFCGVACFKLINKRRVAPFIASQRQPYLIYHTRSSHPASQPQRGAPRPAS